MATYYTIRAEATNPHGGQVEWDYYDIVTADRTEAEAECNRLNIENPTETVNGTVWDIYWIVRKREVI
jgi:hypothetical protein